MGKNNYYLDITANGKPVSNDVLPESFRHFYCMTDERYKKPKVEIYKEANGEYKLYSTYQ